MAHGALICHEMTVRLDESHAKKLDSSFSLTLHIYSAPAPAVAPAVAPAALRHFPCFCHSPSRILALAVGLAFATTLYPCPSSDLVDWWTLVARLMLSVSRICRALPAAVWAALAATTTSGHPAVHQSRAQWLSTASQTSGGSSGSGVPNARWHDRRLSASCRSRTPTHSTARTPRRNAAVCTR